MEPVIRTRATLRSAEFGFFGVVVYTRVQTPRRWGAPFSAGVFDFVDFDSRPLRTSCWIVGTRVLPRKFWSWAVETRFRAAQRPPTEGPHYSSGGAPCEAARSGRTGVLDDV